MDSDLSNLADRITNIEQKLTDLQIVINKLILMIHIADTDLKNQTHLLDS
jgi:hypothetical protein